MVAASQWRSLPESNWTLLDERDGEVLGDAPGSLQFFEFDSSWRALTGGPEGARAFKFVVEESRGDDSLGTKAGYASEWSSLCFRRVCLSIALLIQSHSLCSWRYNRRQFAMSELVLQQCADFDDYDRVSGGRRDFTLI